MTEIQGLSDSLALDVALARIRELEAKISELTDDAERWRAIRPHYCAADFYPEREDGLNLGKGVALIFLMPQGLRVSGDADKTIDAVRKVGDDS
jgi:hypothetical protein